MVLLAPMSKTSSSDRPCGLGVAYILLQIFIKNLNFDLFLDRGHFHIPRWPLNTSGKSHSDLSSILGVLNCSDPIIVSQICYQQSMWPILLKAWTKLFDDFAHLRWQLNYHPYNIRIWPPSRPGPTDRAILYNLKILWFWINVHNKDIT